MGAFSGAYNSRSCNYLGKAGDAIIGGFTGAIAGALTGIGVSGAGGFLAGLTSAIGGVVASSGTELVGMALPSFSVVAVRLYQNENYSQEIKNQKFKIVA